MTYQKALREGYSILFYAEVDTPMLDATVLLCEATGMSKEKLFASLPEPIDDDCYLRYREYLELRCEGIPVSYIRHKKEFYGIEFYVDERVLVPRPDTEVLVEEALALINSGFRERLLFRKPASDLCIDVVPIPKASGDEKPKILDLCTGSGCIAISIAANLGVNNIEIHASDISHDVRAVFDFNSLKILGYKLDFHVSNLFDRIDGEFDLITCNPPYLKKTEVDNLDKIGWREPKIALLGGEEGTEIAGKIIGEAFYYLKDGGYLIMEASPEQMTKLYGLMDARGFKNIYTRRDLGDRERIICGQKKGK